MRLPTTTTITRAELNDILMRRWDHLPKAARMAAARAKLERFKQQREQRRA